MKVTVIMNEYIPSGFKCAGCIRLKKSDNRYYCELSHRFIECDSNGICYKTDKCLLDVKHELLKH